MPDLTAFQRLVLHTLDRRGGATQVDLRLELRKPDQHRAQFSRILWDALTALREAGLASRSARFWTITDQGRAVLAALAKAKEEINGGQS